MSKVIAIGSRGGKIIGYKGGRPIYLQEEKEPSKFTSTGPSSMQDYLDNKPLFSDLKGAMGVAKDYRKDLGERGATLVDLPHTNYDATLLESYSAESKHKAQKNDVLTSIRAFGQTKKSNMKALQSFLSTQLLDQMGAQNMNWASHSYRSALVETDQTKKQLGLATEIIVTNLFGKNNVQSMAVPDSKGAKAYTEILGDLLDAWKSNVEAQQFIRNEVVNAILSLVMGRLGMRAIGATNVTTDLIVVRNDAHVFDGHIVNLSAPMHGLALESEPPFDDNINPANTGSEVLDAVVDFLKNNAPADLKEKLLSNASTIYDDAEKDLEAKGHRAESIKRQLASVATAMGKKMGASKFALGSDDIVRLASHIERDALTLFEAVAGKSVGKPTVPMVEGDKPKPKEELSAPKKAVEEAKLDKDTETTLKTFQAIKDAVIWKKVQDNNNPSWTTFEQKDGVKVTVAETFDHNNNPTMGMLHSRMYRDMVGDWSAPLKIWISPSRLADLPNVPKKAKDFGVVATEPQPSVETLNSSVDIVASFSTAQQKAQILSLAMGSFVLGEHNASADKYKRDAEGNIYRDNISAKSETYEFALDPTNYNFSPAGESPSLLGSLFNFYATSSESKDNFNFDFSDPIIEETLKKIESYELPEAIQGTPFGLGWASRQKNVRQHFELMISAFLSDRTKKPVNFTFAEYKSTDKFPMGEPPEPPKRHEMPKSSFKMGETLKTFSAGVNKARLVENKVDGAKYVYKEFTGMKELSGRAEAVASNIAFDLMGGVGNVGAVPAFEIKNDDGTMGLVQTRVPNKGNVPKANPLPNLTDKQKQDVVATSLVRWLVGDHDGHADQYMYSEEEDGGLIAVDFGNAFKHMGNENVKPSIKDGYLSFNPQSPPPKLDGLIYRDFMKGGGDIDLNHPKIASIITNIERTGSEVLLTRAEPYFELVTEKLGIDVTEKMKKKFKYKIDNVRSEWNTWAHFLHTKRAGAMGEDAPKGFSVGGDGLVKALKIVFGATKVHGQDCLYKAIKTIPEAVLTDDDGFLTETGKRMLRAFAQQCQLLFQDQEIDDSMIAQTPLLDMSMKLSPLAEEVTHIMSDLTIRGHYL